MEQDLPNINSIYDFIYIDSKRIASYISQLDPNGFATGLKSSASASSVLGAGGKADVYVTSGSINTSKTKTEGVERHFDTSLTLPITVMDRLDELGFIYRDVKQTPIGHIFLAKGYMQMFDIRMMQEMWGGVLDLFRLQERAQALEQEAQNLNRNGRKNIRKYEGKTVLPQNELDQGKIIAELLKKIPHSLQLNYLSENGAMLWSTLNPANMVISSDDFSLKHGTMIPGEWHMLGIMDSYFLPQPASLWSELPMSEVARHMIPILDAVRQQFGRPEYSLAVTPLAIFRSVGAIPLSGSEAQGESGVEFSDASESPPPPPRDDTH
ncbi:hypothetical protein [Azospirillum sp.]|uniref:hypothetical protein n=1 Tax=Azospirillum sp. TaxID=34012 RepID=UPI00262DEDDA|nr:hypothetical protein [Azospirillum sp.]